jgi:hypothetical protein
MVDNLGDGAHVGVVTVVYGNEQYALVVPRVDGERDGHVGEDNRVFKWDQEQTRHYSHPL